MQRFVLIALAWGNMGLDNHFLKYIYIYIYICEKMIPNITERIEI